MFSKRLLEWHDKNARDLPWRGEKDPYKIWVSEIMLQQTTAQTVKGYYARFLDAFPTVEALAAADEERVLKLWEGLGYYSRARNLMKAAAIVARDMNGRLPGDAAALKKLPGIGDYTAAAIASMGYGQPEPAMDGNLTRVLARVTAEQGCVGETAVKKRLRAAGEALIDRERPGDFNQAMMGLGNLVCVPGRPRCEQCPVAEFCRAHELGCEGDLPHMPPKIDKKKERRGVAIVVCGERVLVRRRSKNALLGGLWEYPNFENAADAESLIECLEELGVRARFVKRLGAANHVFTHKVWQMTAFLFTAESLPSEDDLRGAAPDELARLPMPTAMLKLRALFSAPDSAQG